MEEFNREDIKVEQNEIVDANTTEQIKLQEETVNNCETKKCKCGGIIGILGLILSVVAVCLFALQFFGVISPKEEPQPEPTIFDKPAEEINVDIAYIDLDTLLLTYNYAVKFQEDLAMEQKKAEGIIQARMKKFEEMYAAYMQKAQAGMFLSASSQQAQQRELENEQQAIENLQTQLSTQLLEKQSAMNAEIYDSVINFANIYAAGRFKVVLGNMGGVNIVYAQEGMNITKDVVEKLNQRYGGILESSIAK